MKLFALADCNNFYVSCERVFNPSIQNVPVVILSNNDGCIISRSQEAKKIGIEMGMPAFKAKHFFNKYGVRFFSSNYALYGDMSRRVSNTLETFSPETEIYSIDESFISISESEIQKVDLLGIEIRQKVLQWTGIPISVGFGPTKTLAKLANRFAKKFTSSGIFTVIPGYACDKVLELTPVSEIWGIGRKNAYKLNQKGINNAREFRDLPDLWLREKLTVTGLRTALELRGISCIALEDAPPAKKAIVSSRSFGRQISDIQQLEEAVSSYTARATEKLRRQNSLAGAITVFLMTNPHKNMPQYSNSICLHLYPETDYTPWITSKAIYALNRIFKKGYSFKKAGVMLTNLLDRSGRQISFNEYENSSATQKFENLMKIVDKTNAKFGSGTLKYASEGIEQNWKMKQNFKSDNYTTNWNEIPMVY
ncbi:Y-family DNA polymerase [Maridesulfovibrio bastinii]|uniref:Y-family DNA polymerase n=1 Tax=Maridesulfovibrio bastinii TaxID=47157 RepID=UPI00041FAE97|nr:Y-family DNA polymerase [Maridesulfovibrio bastinii]